MVYMKKKIYNTNENENKTIDLPQDTQVISPKILMKQKEIEAFYICN